MTDNKHLATTTYKKSSCEDDLGNGDVYFATSWEIVVFCVLGKSLNAHVTRLETNNVAFIVPQGAQQELSKV